MVDRPGMLKGLVRLALLIWICSAIGFLCFSIYEQININMANAEKLGAYMAIQRFFHMQRMKRLSLEQPKQFNNNGNLTEVNLMCIVTLEDIGKTDSRRAAAVIQSTWGRHCDSVIFVGDELITEVPAESFVPLGADNGELWRRIHEKFSSQADWFLKVDLKTLVIVRNLKKYVASMFPVDEEPRFIGRRMKAHGQANETEDFVWHKAGYAINRAALSRLANVSNECSFKEDESQDVTNCLKKAHVFAEDTRDLAGRERFLPYGMDAMFGDGYVENRDWFEERSYTPSKLEGCCSEHAITFGSLSPIDMQRYYYIFYAIN
jgi:hypothetical protein